MSPLWLGLELTAAAGRYGAEEAVVQDARIMWEDGALPARVPASVADWRDGWPPWLW